ncbi:hypothetical protein ABH940_007393 [Streptacidiphilus sp. BW17]|uniref:hypothetical protein n=1 Tax=Streptacidiphilus sp. BW17 TaxID=3156274 RepID=UPI003514993C
MTHATAPDTADGLTPCAAKIYAALQAAPGSKVIALARVAGTANSTTANLLKQMERDGLVRRTRGGSQGNRLLPDHWYLATVPAPDGPEAPVSPGHDPDSSHAGDLTDTDDEAATPPAAPQEAGQPGETGTPAVHNGSTRAENPTAHTGPGPAAPSGEEAPTGRLGQGGLRALVHAFLAAHPDAAHSPTRISRQLGRSSGAVANALVTLVNQRQAEMVTSKPRTYRIVEPPTQSK